MQPGEITIPVDELNDATIVVDNIYTRFEEFANRSVYVGLNHQLDFRDTIALYRTFPKANANFKGVAKSAVKFTKDFTVAGVDGTTSVTAPLIVDVNFSIPVGLTVAQLIVVRQRVLALLDNDLIMTPLNAQLMV